MEVLAGAGEASSTRTCFDSNALADGHIGNESPVGPLCPDFSSKSYQVYCGDALDTICRLKAGGTQFDCVITSPPYFNQRRYGADESREIGRERDVDSFVRSLVNVFAEIPLRPWASVWVNLADKRSKDGTLMCVPHLFIAAMLKNGFFLKDDVVWAKEVVPVDGKSIGHCQIEPAPGRLNGNGWEPFYRFVIDPKRAWADTTAVRIPRDDAHFFDGDTGAKVQQHSYNGSMKCVTSIEGRNLANVWYVGNSRKGGNHYAAFPRELVERPIAMTCPQWLVDDGGEIRPRERIIEHTVYSERTKRFITVYGQYSRWQEAQPDETSLLGDGGVNLSALRDKTGRMDSARQYVARYPRTVGWTNADKPVLGPGIVFDPFGGTGTTGYAAVLLGRRFVGVDLYQEYSDRMAKRCEEAFQMLRGATESIVMVQ